jgi:hypothetical protein
MLHLCPLRPCSKSAAAALLPSALPCDYMVITGFEELGPDSGTHHMVLLKEWTPAWAAPGERLLHSRVALCWAACCAIQE